MRHIRQVTARKTKIIRRHMRKPCPYCGDRMQEPTRDHVVPKSSGAILGVPGAIPDNRMIVCRPCNELKADKDLGTFLSYLMSIMDKDELTLRRIRCVTILVKKISVRYSSTAYSL